MPLNSTTRTSRPGRPAVALLLPIVAIAIAACQATTPAPVVNRTPAGGAGSAQRTIPAPIEPRGTDAAVVTPPGQTGAPVARVPGAITTMPGNPNRRTMPSGLKRPWGTVAAAPGQQGGVTAAPGQSQAGGHAGPEAAGTAGAGIGAAGAGGAVAADRQLTASSITPLGTSLVEWLGQAGSSGQGGRGMGAAQGTSPQGTGGGPEAPTVTPIGPGGSGSMGVDGAGAGAGAAGAADAAGAAAAGTGAGAAAAGSSGTGVPPSAASPATPAPAGPQAVAPGTVIPANQGAPGRGNGKLEGVSFSWPVASGVRQDFSQTGKRGLAFGGRAGDAVQAAADGKVIFSGPGPRGYGNLIIVKHDSDLMSVYAHNRALLVKENDSVRRGQRIAELGDSGTSEPTLLFEIRQQGSPIDPLSVLPRR